MPSSRFSVSGLISQKTGRAPCVTKALMLEGCVNEGQITSAPGSMSRRSAEISSAWVADGVNITRAPPSSAESSFSQRSAISPSPERCPDASAVCR